MLRTLARAWPLLPLALALAYVALRPRLATAPALADVVPPGAVVTARWRTLPMLDRLWCFGRVPDARPSEDLADRHNLPGFPGVDRDGAFHWVLLPRDQRPDPSLLIVPVSDEQALRARYDLRDGALDETRALRRYAKHLEVRGPWAALAWDRDAVRRLGGGGLTLEDRGEDFALALDVPGAVDLTLAQAREQPWRGIVETLGGTPASAEYRLDPATGIRTLAYPFGRIVRLKPAWSTARLWAWVQPARIEVELVARNPARRAALAAAAAAGARGPQVLEAPAVAQDAASRVQPSAWLVVPHAQGVAALAALLEACGAALPEGLAQGLASGTFAAGIAGGTAGEAGGGLEAFAFDNAGAPTWTLALRSTGAQATQHARLLALLLPSTPAPPVPGTEGVIWLGPEAAGRARGTSPAAQPRVAGAAAAQPPGRVLLAQARMGAAQVMGLLGPALQSGGVLSALGPGALDAALRTDGERVFVTLTRP